MKTSLVYRRFHWQAQPRTSYAPFPLTPGERENRFQSVRSLEALVLAKRPAAGLPLPKGDGWGEGEGGVRSCGEFDALGPRHKTNAATINQDKKL
jgi:hypothetical protein